MAFASHVSGIAIGSDLLDRDRACRRPGAGLYGVSMLVRISAVNPPAHHYDSPQSLKTKLPVQHTRMPRNLGIDRPNSELPKDPITIHDVEEGILEARHTSPH